MAVRVAAALVALFKLMLPPVNPSAVAERALMVVLVLVHPVLVPSLVKTVALSEPAVVGPNEPITASFVETVRSPVPPEISTWPAALIVKAVPVLSVVPAAAAIAVCKSATVEAAPAVNTKVPPVAASLIVVTEPFVKASVVARGEPTEPCVDETSVVALFVNTPVPLKLVVEPI